MARFELRHKRHAMIFKLIKQTFRKDIDELSIFHVDMKHRLPQFLFSPPPEVVIRKFNSHKNVESLFFGITKITNGCLFVYFFLIVVSIKPMILEN